MPAPRSTLTGKDALGNETTEAIRVRRNTANTLVPGQAAHS